MEELIRPEIKEIKDYIPGKTVPGLTKLASNENPFGPSPKALEAIKKSLASLHIYPDQKSILLREALAKKFGLKEDCFIVGNGSDDIMQIAAATYLKCGEEAVIPQNTFSVYEFVTRLLGGQPVFVALKNFEQDLDAMAKAIGPKTKIIFLCNPHNPAGTYLPAEKLNAFIKKAPKNILIVVDEAYAEFAEAHDFPGSVNLVNQNKNVLILRTFSKFYGLAGLRIGYGIGQPELIKYMFRAKLPFNVSRLAQAGAATALLDKKFEEKTYKNNLEVKQYFYAQLDKLGLEYKKSEANFVFIKLKKSADQCFMACFKKKVIIRPLTSFGLPQAIRVSIGTKEQNRRFINCL